MGTLIFLESYKSKINAAGRGFLGFFLSNLKKKNLKTN